MANRLDAETSPYLRQHAADPVDWFPWGPEAFNEAQRRDVPLLISVGYATCHWCHVMARESFADPDTAAVLNRLFVNVKVDREEHPDVDDALITAVQATTGRAGWPMTVFALPDGRPFLAGTYFPRTASESSPSLVEVCLDVERQWRNERAAVEEQAGALADVVGRSAELPPAPQPPEPAMVSAAVEGLTGQFDAHWGGFGHTPKFPMALALDFLLGTWTRTGDPAVLNVVTTSLDAMCSGGIHDHIEGGFARYATDRQWLVPHFEKMLVDQALLGRVLVHAHQATGNPVYAQVLTETIGYVTSVLGLPGGGCASGEDAEAGGVEGGHYTWSADDFTATLAAGGLDDVEIEVAVAWWGVTAAGNAGGTNVLYRPRRGDLVRPAPIERARRILAAARRQRLRPGLDDKVVTEGNALWLATLAMAAGALGNDRWREAAVALGDTMATHLRRPDGRWLRSMQHHPIDGPRARHLAGARDHAAVVDAYTRLYELTGDPHWIAIAIDTCDAMVALFWDTRHGGLLSTGRDADRRLPPTKDLTDASVPSANGLAAMAMVRLGAITGNDEWRQRAADICQLVAEPIRRHPTAFVLTLEALALADGGPTEVVVSGDRPDLVSEVQRRFDPSVVLVWGTPWDTPLWEGRRDDSPGRAYVCRLGVCDLPADSPAALRYQLDE